MSVYCYIFLSRLEKGAGRKTRIEIGHAITGFMGLEIQTRRKGNLFIYFYLTYTWSHWYRVVDQIGYLRRVHQTGCRHRRSGRCRGNSDRYVLSHQ